jgi:glutathione S-transferase
MPLTFYYGSGSPFAWKVWLALEHKGVAYEARRLRFDKGETKAPEYLAINPRGKVPAIVEEDGFALRDSAAIVEYLEERHPEPPLLPGDARARAGIRALAADVGDTLYPASRQLVRLTLMRCGPGDPEPGEVADAVAALRAELARWDPLPASGFLAGPDLTLADVTAYPMLAMVRRAMDRAPGHAPADLIPEGLRAWMGRIEALPYFGRTVPPHWKE